MGATLLRLLMILGTLSKEWHDPTQIPVDKIVEQWRADSKKGRYEGEAWKAWEDAAATLLAPTAS